MGGVGWVVWKRSGRGSRGLRGGGGSSMVGEFDGVLIGCIFNMMLIEFTLHTMLSLTEYYTSTTREYTIT